MLPFLNRAYCTRAGQSFVYYVIFVNPVRTVIFKRMIRSAGASVLATSAMTLFSYTLSRMCRENYREPEMLAEILSENDISRNKTANSPGGWLTHFFVGALWSWTDELLASERARVSPSGKTAVLGIGSGIISAIAWRLLLGRHRHILRRTKPSFFVQLVPAHVVYAAVLHACKNDGKASKGKQLKSTPNPALPS